MTDRGAQAELQALRYLEEQGLSLAARNYRGRFGEIDLVMRDGAVLVFVEVRFRSHAAFGGAAASIDARKQQRIVRTAQQYLAGLARIPPCRFDAVLVEEGGVRWLRNAFEA